MFQRTLRAAYYASLNPTQHKSLTKCVQWLRETLRFRLSICGEYRIRTCESLSRLLCSRQSHSTTLPILQLLSPKFAPLKTKTARVYSWGRGGIRTPGGVTLNSFQDYHHKPLGHSSKMNELPSVRLELTFTLHRAALTRYANNG